MNKDPRKRRDECAGCGKTQGTCPNKRGWCNVCWPWAPEKKSA